MALSFIVECSQGRGPGPFDNKATGRGVIGYSRGGGQGRGVPICPSVFFTTIVSLNSEAESFPSFTF